MTVDPFEQAEAAASATPFATTPVIAHGDPIPSEVPVRKEVRMTEDNANLTVTLKAGTGHDVPWIVLRAANSKEMKKLFQDMHDEGLLSSVSNASKAFATGHGGKPAAQPVAVAPVDPWNAGPAPSSVPVKTCQHGNRVRRTGTKADGTNWVAHFCPLPQERKAEQCKAVWSD